MLKITSNYTEDTHMSRLETKEVFVTFRHEREGKLGFQNFAAISYFVAKDEPLTYGMQARAWTVDYLTGKRQEIPQPLESRNAVFPGENAEFLPVVSKDLVDRLIKLGRPVSDRRVFRRIYR